MRRMLALLKYLLPGRLVRKIPREKRVYFYIGIGALIVVVAPLVLGDLFFPKGVKGAWYHNDWLYRKSVAISAHSAEEKNVYISLPPFPTRVYVGKYDGNGTSQPVNPGFQPTFVLIKGDLSDPGVFTTSAMGNDLSKPITGNTAVSSGMITSITSTGFTVGSSASVNQAATEYYYLAIRDLTGTNYKSFEYAGTGVANSVPESICGFTPSLVIVGGESTTATVFRSSHSGLGSNTFNGSEATNRITGFVTNGFTVDTSSTVNGSSTDYYGICVKGVDEFMSTLQYTGNGSDSRNITGIGFQPDFTLTKKLSDNTPAALRFKDNSGDDAPTVTQSNSTNRIQSFVSDGFQVGTDISVNENTSVYNSFSFKTYPAGGSGSGGTAIDTSDTTKFQPDCGDLRFTDQDGNLLPYYIVSGCGTSNTVVNVFFDTFPAGEQTIYYYYGNSSAPNGFSSSNFANEATSAYTIGSEGSEEAGPAPGAYWAFDEGQGTVANDSSSGRKNGTLTGTTLPVWTSSQCVSDKCLRFNGISSNVSVSGTVAGVKSIAFWVNPASSTSGELMALNSIASVRATSGVVSAPNIVSPTIYVNGVLNGTLSVNNWNYVTVTSSTGTSASAITLGKGPLGVLKGYVDEVKFYPSVLSAAQVKSNYVAQGSRVGSGGVLGASDQSYLSKGLVGYWKMDELSANSCSGGSNDSCDSSGNVNDMLWAAAVPAASNSAKFDAGVDFESDNSEYMSITDNSSLSITSSFTISSWVKLESTGTNRTVMAKDANATNQSFYLSLAAGEMRLLVSEDGTTSGQSHKTGSTTLAANTWYHVVGVFNASARTIDVYINGKNDGGVQSGISPPSSIFDGNAEIRIGSDARLGSFMDGVLDDVRLYNRAFSPLEVEKLYNWGPGPTIYYDLEEGSGSTVNDRSGNGFTGTWAGTGKRYGVGKYGKGGDFNGSDNTVSASDSTAWDNFANGSFAVWVRPTFYNGSAGIQHTVSTKNVGGANMGDVSCGFIGSSGAFRCNFEEGTNQNVNVDTSVIPLNQWSHIAYTWINNGTTVTFTPYVNGVAGTSRSLNHVVRPFSQANSFILGETNFKGSIDEYRFYNYTRTPKQIIEDMSARNGAAVVGNTPIGYWKFDDGFGNVASNSGSMGNALNAGLYSMSSPPSANSGWTSDGKYGKGINFDGTDDRVVTPNFIINGEGSVSVWVLARGGGSAQGLLDTNPSTNGAIRIATSTNWSSMEANVPGDSAVAVDLPSNFLNNWHHILRTYGGGVANTYLDGKLIKSVSYTTTPTANRLIAGNYNASNYFKGEIDELKFYNFALSSQEVKSDYNNGRSIVLGSFGMDSSGRASSSASAVYCVPGDTTQACAPVGEWRFEEKKGEIAVDSSGRGNNGSLVGSPSYQRGKVGSGLRFTRSATNNYVNVSDSSSLSPVEFSTSLWVYLVPGGVNGGDFITKQNLWSFSVDGNNLLLFNAGAGGNLSGGTLLKGAWYHLVGTYDNVTGARIVYVNGRQIGQSTVSAGDISDNALPLVIGRNTGNDNEPDAIIDEVKVYDYTLSAAQVAWDYNQGKAMGKWKFDECQGSRANDSSGNSRFGTITIGGSGTASVGTCNTASSAWLNGVSGKFNYSLDLDGTDDYITVGSPNLPTNDFTASSWVNLGTATDESILMAANGTGGDELRVHVNSSGQIELYTAGILRVTSRKSISTGSWNNIVVASSSGVQKIYINGVQDGNTGSAVTQMGFSTCSLLIGVDADGTCTGSLGNYMDGKIDEVQIYNYPLTNVQIKNLYNQNSAVRFGPVTGTP